ncbi:hypothetical protein LSCM1_07851 [Leishmania martiniquensis]|uniref:Uncharacterized protein n=1 Tax=Leishmania martiniquensis TaxID=1580590 RepID=A0A836HUH1_9TRYP|nr:hypothetical protein LSCM1_07851 [Leishmania martiniquensis]
MPVPPVSSSATATTCDGGSATAPVAGRVRNAGSLRASVRFNDALGMLWYALLLVRESHKEQQRQLTWSGVKRAMEDGLLGKETKVAVEGAWRSSGDAGANSSSDSKGNTRAAIAGVSPSTSATASTLTAARWETCDFDSWGHVDWTLLAAHVYALTGELYSARALHRVVAEDIYTAAHKSDREAMRAAYAWQHAEMLHFYAKEAQEEEGCAAATPLQTTFTISGSTTGDSRLGGVLQADSSSAPSLSKAGTHSEGFPATTAIQGTASSWGDSRKAGASDASPLPSARSDAQTSSLAPSLWASASAMSQAPAQSLPASPPPGAATQVVMGGAIMDGRMACARGSSPTPSLRDTNAVERHAADSAGRAVAPTDGEPMALPPGAEQCSSRAAADHTATTPGESRRTGLAQKSDRVAFPSTPLFDPDPLDAPWYALWCSLPSPQARAQLHVLRYATPLPLEDFSSLLEQFFLVDGADDFLSPVHAATIMEFAGVRSGPYNTIVHSPLSLAEVRRYISESHRHYARAAMMAHTNHAGGAARVEATSRLRPGTPPLDTGSAPATSFKVGASHAVGSGSGFVAASATTSTKAEYRGLRRGGVPPAGALGNSVRSLLDSTASSEKRVLTLAELERSIWHVAANCAVFNAPESRYPRTARHFAASCIAIMTRYCEKQLAVFYTN